MKPRQAAALALVGWYLWMPAWGKYQEQWNYVESLLFNGGVSTSGVLVFDSYEQCRQYKKEMTKAPPWWAEIFANARCIQFDPRLAK